MTAGAKANLGLALAAHAIGGLFWVVALSFAAFAAGGAAAAVVWAASAAGLWLVAVAQMTRSGAALGRVWRASFLWWLASFAAPVVLAWRVIRFIQPQHPPKEDPMEGNSLNRVDGLDRRVRKLEGEVTELKDLVAFVARRDPLPATPPPRPVAAPTVVRVERQLPPEPKWEPWIEPAQPTRPEPAAAPRFTFDPAAVFGARSLAWAGGFVTLLGILFFFVLAVNRGLIGPSARVALGAAASALVFGAGIWLRRRFGDTYSALASVGAGLASGFGTLLAAAALYHLLPDYAALIVAAGIALAGVVTSLVWSSELVAAFGLVGAALVPVAVVAQGGLTTLGTSFAVIVFAATALVAVQQRWRWLLVAGVYATLPQVAVLVGRQEGVQWQLVLLAGVASSLCAGAGIAWHRRTEAPPLGSLTTSLVGAGASLAVYSAVRLYGTEQARGIAVLAVALVLGSAAAVFFRSARMRDLSAFLGVAGLTAGAIAFGELMSGQPLAFAWAAEAAALAWLARRIREVRYQILSFAYLGLAIVHVAAFDASPSRLFRAGAHPGSGALAALAVTIAVAIVGAHASAWPTRYEGPLAQLLTPFQEGQQNLRTGSFWVAGVLTAYTAALGLLQLFVSAGAGFGWGHVAVDCVWAAAGLGILLAGLRRDSLHLVSGGFAWLGATALVAVLYDWKHLATDPRSVAFLLLAGFALAAGIAYEVRRRIELVAGIGGISVVASLAFALAAVIPLASTQHLVGASLLGLAAVYGSLSAVLFGRRDLATLLGGFAVALAAVAAPLLVEGTWLVLAWAAGSAVLSVGAARLEEPRLKLAALAYVALALGDALAVQAPPSDLFRAHVDPAAGVPAVLLGLAALALFGRFERHVAVWWAGGVVALYAASLSILELVEDLAGRAADRLPARPQRDQRLLGARRPRPPLRGPDAAPSPPDRGLRALRRQPRQALPLRPDVPQLGHPCALVPRGWGAPPDQRVLLPAAAGQARHVTALSPLDPARGPPAARGASCGVATCTWNVPAAGHGKTIRGTITVVYNGVKVTRLFSAKVA